VAPALTGFAAFLLAWLAFGKRRSKEPASTSLSASAAAKEREERETERPPADSKPAPASVPKPAAAAVSKPAPAPVSKPAPAVPSKAAPDAPPKPATAKASKHERPASRAIVWESLPAELVDEDITVVHAIPIVDGGEISIEAASVSIESEAEEDRVSRIELSYEEDAEAEEVTAASARILIHAAGDSDQGRVRKRNEDSLLVMPERSLFAVADGMGGHRGGAVASSLAIDALQDAFDRSACTYLL
jgi:hypothetical protein